MLAKISVTRSWVDLWLESYQSINTRDNYSREIKRFFEIVPKELPDITRADLLMFRDHLVQMNLGATSRNRAMAAVKSLFGFVNRCEPDYLVRNVTSSVKAEIQEAVRKPVVVQDKVRALFNAEMTALERVAVQFLYYSGCRAHELSTITWEDLTLHQAGVGVRIMGKGHHEYHSEIPRGLYEEMQAVCGISNPPIPLDRHELYRIVQRIGREALGIPNLSPHCLRHACATHLASAGVPVHLVQQHLGHASLRTTQQYFDRLPNDTVVSTLIQAVQQ